MNYTKFEIARLLGARALQIKMDAPILVKVPKGVERSLDIARLELKKGVLPITVKRKEMKVKHREIKVIPKIAIEETPAEVKGKEAA